MAALMAIVLYSVHRGFASGVRGPRHWAAGALLFACTAVLFGLRGVIPDWLSVIGGNAGLLAGAVLWLIGLQLFYGLRPARRLAFAGWALGVACASWWLLVDPDYQARLTSVTAVLAIIFAAQCTLVLRHGQPHFDTYFLAVTLLVQTLVLLIRFGTSLDPARAGTDIFTADWLQTAYLATYSFTALLQTVAFIMVASRRLQTDLERRAASDPLTGLLNRRAFAAMFEQQRSTAERLGRPLALLLIDLDNFKAINDRHGHVIGDRVLLDFCRRIGVAIDADAPFAHFARLGGEEFAVLLPDTTQARALERAEAMRAAVQRDEAGLLPLYTCSIGVASLSVQVASLDQLLVAADTALYRAKSSGRNRIEGDNPGRARDVLAAS